MQLLEGSVATPSELDELARTLRLLSNADRLSMLCLLATGEQDVGSLAKRSNLSACRTSQHLALLRAHDVVRDRREGRRVFYRLVRPGLVRWLQSFVKPETLRPENGGRP